MSFGKAPEPEPGRAGSRAVGLAPATLLTVTLLLVTALAGCVQPTIDQVRFARTGPLGDQSVVILSRKHKTQGETENDFISCVSDSVAAGDDSLSVLAERQFVDSVFPWFEPRTAPLTMDKLGEVIAEPLVGNRIRDIGVRYLVWIEGTTERTDQAGTVQCTVFTGGMPACFGFLSWEDASNYEASIWDVSEGIAVGKVTSEAVGTSFIPAVVIPIPFIARVQPQACTNLSDQIKSFLGDGSEA